GLRLPGLGFGHGGGSWKMRAHSARMRRGREVRRGFPPSRSGPMRRGRSIFVVDLTRLRRPYPRAASPRPAAGGSRSTPLFLPPLCGGGGRGGRGVTPSLIARTSFRATPFSLRQLPPQAGEARALGFSFPRLRGMSGAFEFRRNEPANANRPAGRLAGQVAKPDGGNAISHRAHELSR